MTEPFHFPDGRVANNAEDLLKLCEQYPDDATGFLMRQDLEKWLAYIGSYEVAECAANARQIELGDRQKLEDFLTRCHSLASPQAFAPDTPEPTKEPIEESPVASVSTSSLPIAEALSEPTIQAPSGQDLSQAPLPEQMFTPETAPEPASVQSAEPATSIVPVLPVIPTTPVAKTTTPPNGSTVKIPVNSNSINTNEVKPSFFQVVAKFIVQILYRDQA